MRDFADQLPAGFPPQGQEPRMERNGSGQVVSWTWFSPDIQQSLTLVNPVRGGTKWDPTRLQSFRTLADKGLGATMDSLGLGVSPVSDGAGYYVHPSAERFVQAFNQLPTPGLDEGAEPLQAELGKRWLPYYSSRTFIGALASRRVIISHGPIARRRAKGFSIEEHDVGDHGPAFAILRNSAELTEPLVAQAQALHGELQATPRFYQAGKWLCVALRGKLGQVIQERSVVRAKLKSFVDAFDVLFESSVMAALPDLTSNIRRPAAARQLFGDQGVHYFIDAAQASIASYARLSAAHEG